MKPISHVGNASGNSLPHEKYPKTPPAPLKKELRKAQTIEATRTATRQGVLDGIGRFLDTYA